MARTLVGKTSASRPSSARANDPRLHPGRSPSGQQDWRQETDALGGGILEDNREVDIALRPSVTASGETAVEDQRNQVLTGSCTELVANVTECCGESNGDGSCFDRRGCLAHAAMETESRLHSRAITAESRASARQPPAPALRPPPARAGRTRAPCRIVAVGVCRSRSSASAAPSRAAPVAPPREGAPAGPGPEPMHGHHPVRRRLVLTGARGYIRSAPPQSRARARA